MEQNLKHNEKASVKGLSLPSPTSIIFTLLSLYNNKVGISEKYQYIQYKVKLFGEGYDT